MKLFKLIDAHFELILVSILLILFGILYIYLQTEFVENILFLFSGAIATMVRNLFKVGGSNEKVS